MRRIVLATLLLLGGTAAADDGAPAIGEATASRPIPSSDPAVHYALGARGRLLVVPGWMLGALLDQHTRLTSGAVGVEFTRRKGSLDIVTSLDFSFYGLPDGNFLGRGKDPAIDTHYTQFRNLNLISLDVTFVWHHDVAPWMSILLGGGIGIGVLLGDIYVLNSSQLACNKDNAGDPERCFPVSGDSYRDASGTLRVIGPIRPSDPDFQSKLDATTAAQAACHAANADGKLDCRDTAMHPYFHRAVEKPPVAVVFNLVLGVRLKVNRHFNVNVTGGFRDGWYFGAGPEYVF